MIWPLKNVFKSENGLQKNPLAKPGLKIESFASVNIATAFSDSISNVHSVVYLANMGMWKIQGKKWQGMEKASTEFCKEKSLKEKVWQGIDKEEKEFI